jgi:hypothetical protein
MKQATYDNRAWEKEFFGVACESANEGSKRAQGHHRARGAVWNVDAFHDMVSGSPSFSLAFAYRLLRD